MSQQLDTQGEAHEALGTAVASYGQRVLSDPHTLGNLVTSANQGSNCPPAKGDAGTSGFHSDFFPSRSGQVLECIMLTDSNGGSPQPVYTWTFPTENAILAAVGPPNSSFAALKAWFASVSMPLASPSPAAS